MYHPIFNKYADYPNFYYIGSCYDGPKECKSAVNGIIFRLQQEYPADIEVTNKSDTDLTYGYTFKSQNKDFLVGTLLWRCDSHLRHDTSEKDWYVFIEKLSKCDSKGSIQRQYETIDKDHIVRIYDGLNFNLRKL